MKSPHVDHAPDEQLWMAMLSPLSQPCGWRTRVECVERTRVEHLLLALLEPSADDEWLRFVEPAERTQVLADSRAASERASLLLQKLNVDAEKLRRELRHAASLEPPCRANRAPRYSSDFHHIWRLAFEEARAMEAGLVEPDHIVVAALRWAASRPWWTRAWPFEPDAARQVLAGLGVDVKVARVVARAMSPEVLVAPRAWSERVAKAVHAAHEWAIKTHCGRIAPAHLLLGMLRDDELTREAWKYLGVADADFDSLRSSVRKSVISDGEIGTGAPRFGKESREVFERAKSMAKRAGYRVIDEPLLLLSVAMQLGTSAQMREVLAEDAQALAARLYPSPKSHRKHDVEDEPARNFWSVPQGAMNWMAFLAVPLCWASMFSGYLPAATGAAPLALGASFLLALTVLFVEGLSRNGRVKIACQNFLLGLLAALAMTVGYAIWGIWKY